MSRFLVLLFLALAGTAFSVPLDEDREMTLAARRDPGQELDYVKVSPTAINRGTFNKPETSCLVGGYGAVMAQ